MEDVVNTKQTNFKPRGGIIYPIEGGKWLVGLSGIGKNYPPVDEKGFLEFAKHLESSELYDALKEATPDSEILGYQARGSRQYHYEKMSSWPQNFVVFGDAVSVFNPFYGQGITSAALCAKVFEDMLKNHKIDSSFTQQFQKKIAKTDPSHGFLAQVRISDGLQLWVFGPMQLLKWYKITHTR